MDKCFLLITQLRNLTDGRVRFGVEYSSGNRFQLPMPVLPPGKTRQLKLRPMMRWLRGRHEVPELLKIRVIVDDEFTGIELNPKDLLVNTRIVFRYESNVLCVDRVKENCSDFFFRIKYLGFARNMAWDRRASTELKRSDSRLATQLREIEAVHVDGQHLAPSADTNLQQREIEVEHVDGLHLAPSMADTNILRREIEVEHVDGLHLAPSIADTNILKSVDRWYRLAALVEKLNRKSKIPKPPPAQPPINSVDRWYSRRRNLTSKTTRHHPGGGRGGVATKHIFLSLLALAFFWCLGFR